MDYKLKYLKYKKKYLDLKKFNAKYLQPEGVETTVSGLPQNYLSKIPLEVNSLITNFSNCKNVIKFFILNKDMINQISENQWDILIGNITAPGFNFNQVRKTNLLCGFNSNNKCNEFIAKCLYKHLYDKYESVDEKAWFTAIMQNNKNDFDLFSYFIDTTKIPNFAHNTYNRLLQMEWGDNYEKRHIDIPNSVTNIGMEAFRDSRIKSLTIPDSVVEINAKAFQNNELKSVTIPSSVGYIRYGTFDKNVKINRTS